MARIFNQTLLEGLIVAEGTSFDDQRGFFSKIFSQPEFSFLKKGIVDVNYSVTREAGTVRGLHFQREPHMETKIVTCVEGEIFDVAVDLRKDSPTFLQWHGEILKGGVLRSMIIPEGMAHGFQVLSSEARMVYLHTESYHPESEGRLHPQDPNLKISWPLLVKNLSARDSKPSPIDLNSEDGQRILERNLVG